MTTVFQFPIADLRLIHEDIDTYKLLSGPLSVHIRHMGPVMVGNHAQKSDKWALEETFFGAEKSIRIENLAAQKLALDNFNLLSEVAFRRFHTDWEFKSRFEIAFSNKLEQLLNHSAEPGVDLDQYLKKILKFYYSSLNVGVFRHPVKHDGRKDIAGLHSSTTLSEAGSKLSDLFLHSTSTLKSVEDGKVNTELAFCGDPICIVELSDKQQLLQSQLKETLIKDFGKGRAKLYSTQLDNRVQVWIILNQNGDNLNFLMNLRTNLLRINVLKTTLKAVIQHLSDNPDKIAKGIDEKSKLGRFLKNTGGAFFKGDKFSIDQTDIRADALAMDGDARKIEWAMLKSAFASIEPLIGSPAVAKDLKKVYNLDKEIDQRDLFISYAGEDWDTYVRPLTTELESKEVKYWLDRADILPGNAFERKIQFGLTHSRFVLAGVSNYSLKKWWPKKERELTIKMEENQEREILIPIALVKNAQEFNSILKDDEAFYLSTKNWLRYFDGLPAVTDKLLAAISPLIASGQVKGAKTSRARASGTKAGSGKTSGSKKKPKKPKRS